MSEEKLFQLMMISCACLAALCGLGAVALVVACAMSFAIGVLVCALLLAGAAVGSAYYAVFFSSKAQAPRVFNNQDEKEVLNRKQHKILKDARAEVVMERALIEIRHEQENIVHNQLEAANDPDRPPHQTRWTEGVRNAISGKRPGDL
jgi:membrane protein implicated in regulation of membrane protease activity